MYKPNCIFIIGAGVSDAQLNELCEKDFSFIIVINETPKVRSIFKHFEISRSMLINGSRETNCIIMKNSIKTDNIHPSQITIALLLKTGGNVYNYEYVNSLVNQIRKNISNNIEYEIVCLTDDATNIQNVDRIVKLKHGFPGWWSKIELFRSDISKNKIVYFDLDTVIVGNIDEIINLDSSFCGLLDFYNMYQFASGVMSWIPSEETCRIYKQFLVNPDYIIKHYLEGDQMFIRENVKQYDFFQTKLNKKIVSFKKHCLQSDNTIQIPKSASVICFHGNPRPHTITDKIISDIRNAHIINKT